MHHYSPERPAEPFTVQELAALRLDYFLDPSCRLYQNPKHFCFNSDSFALAQFCRIHRGERILEIGTNNGALLVYLSRFLPQTLTGVEILEEPARLAACNLSRFVCGRWDLYAGSIEDLEPGAYDVVLCNPPFFPVESLPAAQRNSLSMRQLGRFEKNLDLRTLCEQAARQLRSCGRFCLVHRPERLRDCLQAFEQNGLCLSRLQTVYDCSDGQAKAILLEAVRDGSCQPVIEPALFRDRSGRHSALTVGSIFSNPDDRQEDSGRKDRI